MARQTYTAQGSGVEIPSLPLAMTITWSSRSWYSGAEYTFNGVNHVWGPFRHSQSDRNNVLGQSAPYGSQVLYANLGQTIYQSGVARQIVQVTAYTLTLMPVVINGSGTGGAVSGGGESLQGQGRTATATANGGYRFVKWSTDAQGNSTYSSNASVSVTMSSDITLYAVFQQTASVSLSVGNAAHGEISRNGTSWGTATLTDTIDVGVSVTRYARGKAGYVLSHINKNNVLHDPSGTSPFQLAATTGANSFQAVFAPITLYVKASDDSFATVSVSSSALAPSTSYTVTITKRNIPQAPKVTGYSVDGGAVVPLGDVASFVWTSPPSVSGDIVITVILEQTTFRMYGEAAGDGTVLFDIGFSATSIWAVKDTAYQVTATPDAHHRFERFEASAGLTVSGITINPSTGVAAADVRNDGRDGTVTAYFVPSEWQLSARMNPESGAGTIHIGSPGMNDLWYPLGTLVSANVICVPVATKKVRDWTTPWGTRPGSAGTSATLNVGAQSASVTVTANIIDRAYDLTVGKGAHPDYGTLAVLINGQVQVTDEFTKSVDGGHPVKITAAAGYGRKFQGWDYPADIAETPDGAVFEFVMPDAAVYVTANFIPKADVILTAEAVNISDPERVVGTVTLRRQDGTPEGATTLDEPSRAFGIFAEEGYVLAATDNDDDYTFLEWRDGDGNPAGGGDDPLRLAFTPVSGGALAYRAVYTLRRSEPIEVAYKTIGGDFDDPQTRDGCALTVTTPPSGEDGGVPVWLVGYSRVVAFSANGAVVTPSDGSDQFRWGVAAVNVIDTGGNSIPINFEKAPASVTGSFLMRDRLTVELVLVRVDTPNWRGVTLDYMPCCGRAQGSFSVYPVDPEDGAFFEDAATGRMTVMEAKGRPCTISACPAPGYAFEGWYEKGGEEYVKVSGTPIFDFTVPDTASVFLVKFAESGKSVRQWNAGDEVLVFEWRSKVFVASVPFNPSCARVYADSYPLLMRVFMASSPEDVMRDGMMREVRVRSQDPFRLPMRRPEKYMAIEIVGNARVSFAAVGTSMGGLRDGR